MRRLGQFFEPGVIKTGIVQHFTNICLFHTVIQPATGRHRHKCARFYPFTLHNGVRLWIAGCTGTAVSDQIRVAYNFFKCIDDMNIDDLRIGVFQPGDKVVKTLLTTPFNLDRIDQRAHCNKGCKGGFAHDTWAQQADNS
ncbi:hypothetical protein D3C84_964000 [compost metagenome]